MIKKNFIIIDFNTEYCLRRSIQMIGEIGNDKVKKLSKLCLISIITSLVNLQKKRKTKL